MRDMLLLFHERWTGWQDWCDTTALACSQQRICGELLDRIDYGRGRSAACNVGGRARMFESLEAVASQPWCS